MTVKKRENPSKWSQEDLVAIHKVNHRRIKALEEEGIEVFQVDESVFIGGDKKRKAWSQNRKNIEVSDHWRMYG